MFLRPLKETRIDTIAITVLVTVNKCHATMEQQVEAERRLLKQEFDEEKARILAALPPHYTSLWGRIGFAKTNWGNDWLPCAFVGPYDLSPTCAMRQLWMETFVSVNDYDMLQPPRHAMAFHPFTH